MSFPAHIPFVGLLGLELLRMDGGQAEIALELRPELLNSFGVAHGGVCMTLLDVTMAQAARSLNAAQANFGPGVVTVEMKTSFMRPGEGRLRALGQVLHRSTTLAFCEARVLDVAERLVAHATGSFKYISALPAAGRRTKALQRRLDGPGSD